MKTVLRRATNVMLACLFVLIVTPHLAGAQSLDYSSDYPSDYANDDTPDVINDLFDTAMTESAPAAAEALPGVPAQAFDLALAQSPASVNPAAGVPARFLAIENHFDVHADESTTATSHIEMQLLSPQAVAALAQPALTYSDSLQSLEIKNAYTLKRDGTRLPVAPDAILVRQKAVPSPLFTDLKEKVILFPNVEPGDTLVYDSIVQSQPPIPGQFYFAAVIPRVVEIDNETLSFTVPNSRPLNFDTYGLAVQKSAEGDTLTYTIHYTNRMPVLELPQFLSDLDHGQRIFASSAGTFDVVAQAYAPMLSAKIVVTPRVLAKADEITAGIADRREQARKLYEWVAQHIRYVALLFGDGGLVPHAADAILANGYGDCKDHAALYSALLKAKGIASEPVVINATNGYFLPQVPEFLTFNHMIVWLPEFGLYADTTANSAPFGQLPLFEYGKPVIRVGSGSALQHTPILAESDSTYVSSTVMQLDEQGRLSGTHHATATGALSGVMRIVANQTAAKGLDAVAGAVLRARKMDSATGTVSFAPTADLGPQYAYSSQYQFNRGIETDAGFALPEGLNLVDAYSPAILGPIANGNFLTSDTLPCFSGRLVDDYTLVFPADKRLAYLPPDGVVTSANIDYRSHWTLAGNTLSVHRELRAHFDKALCTGSQLRDARAAIIAIQKDYGTRIVLTTAHAS
jgi:transglutaminase-like putative cysteine protease